jgi:hypothetical protein
MNSLASRKKLLIAESELNRAQLAEGLAELKADACTFTHGAGTLVAVAASAMKLAADLAALRWDKPSGPVEKPNWMNTALKGANLISKLWLTLRPAGRDQPAK